jgi:hypothetical protein
MHTPGNPRKSFRPEAEPVASGALLHLSQMAGERLPFGFGTTGYTMSIVRHFGLKAPYLIVSVVFLG